MSSQARVLIFVLAVHVIALAANRSSPCLLGIDHLPLAVRDLDQAADRYRRLGFALKPGRFHENGIRNEHVKFEDGAGIELITASNATDAQSASYLQLLRQGEGPAFLSFHTSSIDNVKTKLAKAGYRYSEANGFLEIADPRLNFIFIFEGDNRSPTDLPEYFRHSNTAHATIGVWIADGEDSPLIRLLATVGAEIVRKNVFVPHQTMATVAKVQNGEVIFLPVSRQVIHGRPIIGVVFATRDLDGLRRALSAGHLPTGTEVNAADYQSLVLEPKQTAGVWLEFRQDKK